VSADGTAFLWESRSPPDLEWDVKAWETLRELYIPLAQLLKKVRDTMTLLGSEAVTGSLTYYGTAKEGRKRGKPGSILVCEELGKRFPCRPKKKAEKME
jgi:hypothetical protein